MLCAADNHNNMCHKRAKEFLDSNFDQAVIDKISNFTYLLKATKIVIFKV